MPDLCHESLGCEPSETISYRSPSCSTALRSSSSLSDGTATLLGTLRPSTRLLAESKYRGHKTILFSFRIQLPLICYKLKCLIVSGVPAYESQRKHQKITKKTENFWKNQKLKAKNCDLQKSLNKALWSAF